MKAKDYAKPEDWEQASRDLATFNNCMTVDEVVNLIATSLNYDIYDTMLTDSIEAAATRRRGYEIIMKGIETDIIDNWLNIRANAIEIGLMAERNLIAAGRIAESDRRILSRDEARQAKQDKIDKEQRIMIR